VGRKFFDDGCLTLAGSLTYTTLLALVPLLTIALTLITAFPVFEQFTHGVDDFFAKNVLPPAVAETVTGHIQQFTASAAKLTAAGIVLLGVTAILLMMTIERAFNGIWRVTRPRRLGVRILMYWAVLTLGPLLIGMSLTITSYLVTVSLGFARQIPGAATLVLAAVPVLFTATAFTLVYLVVPNRPVRLVHAVAGGVAAAVMFELMKRGLAFYIARFPSYTLVYGAFAAVPIFLVWVYLSWVVTLLGAVIAALIPDYRLDDKAPTGPGAVFRAALAILRVLVLAQRDSRMPATHAVLEAAGVRREAGQQVLELLAARGWVARVVGERWTLACDPEVVTIAEVYRGLVFDPMQARGHRPDEALEAILERAATGAARSLDAPIRSLAGENAAVSSPR
jgi:membrane protein